MPQKTNLNISPYYDDFSKDKQFYKVLFRPGYPVQARELTTLQSTLQNQVESFGSHMFKEGSMVIPGNIAFDNQYYSIKLLSTFNKSEILNLCFSQLISLTDWGFIIKEYLTLLSAKTLPFLSSILPRIG